MNWSKSSYSDSHSAQLQSKLKLQGNSSPSHYQCKYLKNRTLLHYTTWAKKKHGYPDKRRIKNKEFHRNQISGTWSKKARQWKGLCITDTALQEATKVVSGYKRVLALGSMTHLPSMIKEPAEAQTQSISMQMALNLVLIHRKPAL